jgi:hypothetical protein
MLPKRRSAWACRRISGVSRLACLAVVALLASACGTGGTVTVTVPASSDSGGSSTSETTESPTKLLAAYIGGMHKAEGQWNHAQSAWTKALGHNLNYQETTPWPAVSRKLARVRHMFDSSAIYVTGVTPPAGLAKAHQAWLASVRLASADVDSYVTGFETKNVSAVYRLDNNDSRLHRMGELRTTWRLAVLAAAKQLSVHVPKALRKVGTGY